MRYLQEFQNFIFESQVPTPYTFKDPSKFKTKWVNQTITLPQQNKTYNLPYKVSCGYKADDCDQLHAFQETQDKNSVSYNVGNLNMIVKEWLDYFYSQGINPEVSNIDIKVSGMQVNWVVTIDKSKDGKAWVGFSSRGAGCNNDIVNRSKDSYDKMSTTLQNNQYDVEEVKEFTHNGGNNSFTQKFAKFTKPKENPPHGSNQQSTGGQSQLDIKAKDLQTLMTEIKTQSLNGSFDETSIVVNLDKTPYTFTCKPGKTKVFKLVLLLNETSDSGKIPSVDKVINANKTDYPNTKILSQGTFEVGKRNWAIVGLIV